MREQISVKHRHTRSQMFPTRFLLHFDFMFSLCVGGDMGMCGDQRTTCESITSSCSVGCKIRLRL